jgi:putative ABC transport system permease protein
MATKRAKEVGIKKALGAQKGHLIIQFLFEAMLTITLSMILAVTLIQVLLPFFNSMTGKSLSLFNLPMTYLVGGVIFTLLLGIISGSYPAFFLSSFKTIRTLSGRDYKMGSKNITLRQGLVIVQFAISSFLICATIIILNQWNYLRNRSLGLDTEQFVSVSLHSRATVNNYQIFKEELLKRSDVLEVTGSSKSVTGRYDGFNSVSFEDESLIMPYETIDDNFFEAMNISIEGRSFSTNILADTLSMILNQKAVDDLGITDPIGKRIGYSGEQYKIIGVVDNFHFEPLYTKLGPVVFISGSQNFSNVYVKINMSNLQETINGLESTWSEVNSSAQFHYSFVDDEIQQVYESEQRFFWIFIVFSSLAIIIACLGLFGLAGFTVSQKVKEIGIRKTLGASSVSIVVLLSRKFSLLVIIANVISWPIAYIIMNRWLEKFPYHISITIGVFVIAGVLSVLIALLSVSGNSLKASMVNPVDSLRYD